MTTKARSTTFGAISTSRREIFLSRKTYDCGFGCGEPITPGMKYVKVTTPPWYGEWDGDVGDNGRPIAYPINTHRWTTMRYHAFSENCPQLRVPGQDDLLAEVLG